MSQTRAILADLRNGIRLTPKDALRLYGSARLAARIVEARALLREDEEIVSERVTVGGAVVARYTLRHRVPAQVPLWQS